MDGVRVTGATCLCQNHFSEKEIKQNPNRWKLVAGAVPSRNLYYSVTPYPPRKEPRDRSTSQLSKEMQENAYSSTTSASSSTSDFRLIPFVNQALKKLLHHLTN